MKNKNSSTYYIILVSFMILLIIFIEIKLENSIWDFLGQNILISSIIGLTILFIYDLIGGKAEDKIFSKIFDIESVKIRLKELDKKEDKKGKYSIWHKFNGKCYSCNHDSLRPSIKYKKLLECNNCKKLNNNTFPVQKILFFGFLISLLSELPNFYFSSYANEFKLIILIITSIIVYFLSKKWVNTEAEIVD